MSLRVRAALVAAVLPVAAWMGCGCTSTPSADVTTPSEEQETAPQAWERLKNQKDAGGVLEMGGQIFSMVRPSGGGNAVLAGTGAANKLLSAAIKEADTEVGQAMQSNLPVEALDAMVDDIAQKMAATIPNVPEVKAAPTQLLLAFETIDDKAAPDNQELAAALDQLRSRLSKSERMTNNFVFVSTTETDAAKVVEKVDGKDLSVFRDPLQRTPDTTHPVKYEPNSIFLITGGYLSTKDIPDHQVQVKLSLQFTHVLSRRTVETEQFTRTYEWHPTKHKWEQQPT